MSVTQICPEGNLHPLALGLLIGLAVIDTWFDGLRISVVLVAIHALLIRFTYASHACSA